LHVHVDICGDNEPSVSTHSSTCISTYSHTYTHSQLRMQQVSRQCGKVDVIREDTYGIT